VRGIAARIIAFSAFSLILILALGVGTAAGQEPPNEGPGPDPTRKLIAKRSLTLNTRGPDGNPVGKQVLPLALFLFHHLSAHVYGWRQVSLPCAKRLHATSPHQPLRGATRISPQHMDAAAMIHPHKSVGHYAHKQHTLPSSLSHLGHPLKQNRPDIA
jgi:hypothetical protein